MEKYPLSHKNQATLINPHISKTDLEDLIHERLDQLEGMSYMINSRGDNSAGELADHHVENAHWLIRRTLSETQNLFALYVERS